MEELSGHATLQPASVEDHVPANRRAGERHLTLFRVGSLLVGKHRQLCLVKNVSTRGALLRAYCELRERQMVALELKEQQPIPARVSWVKGSDIGLEFDNEIDVLDLLKVGGDGPRPRMPRIDVRSPGTIRQGAIVYRIAVNNISQGGLSAQCNANLAVGGEVTVMLPSLAPQKAVVRWSRSGGYGITFNNVLGLPTLVEWLKTQSGAGRG